MAGEAGHIVVKDEGGSPCGCGGSGCLEQFASATAVMRMARERLGDIVPSGAHEVARLARSGSREAHSVFDTVGNALAVALTGLLNTLNLPLYLLGGGVCDAWDLFSPSMFRELEVRSYVYRFTKPQVQKPDHLEARKTYILGAGTGTGSRAFTGRAFSASNSQLPSCLQERISLSINRYVLRSTFVGALGGLLFGFDTAVISGTTAGITHAYGLSPNQLGITVSIALWGTGIWEL